jgi:threonine aldolase
MIIDLRSDTVTKPTQGMLQAMFNAAVGDDVFEEDPTVKDLEQRLATMFGKEAGIFCPSGTMTNQIAIKIHTTPPGEVICDRSSHIYVYEGGGIAFNSGASVRLLEGNRGRMTAKEVAANINPDNIHNPVTQLVSLEDTCNRGGGCYYNLEEIKKMSEVCRKQNLPLHLDGARVFNALVETGYNYKEYGSYFDTISVCLSKGLGTPVGSVLLGTKEHIRKARRIRKIFGGGMRQVGYLAAAGLYALDHHIERLKEDHQRARILGDTLKKLPYVEELFPVDTNIVVFRLNKAFPLNDYLATLAAKKVKAIAFGEQMVRFVTHLEFTDQMLEQTLRVMKEMDAVAKL